MKLNDDSSNIRDYFNKLVADAKASEKSADFIDAMSSSMKSALADRCALMAEKLNRRANCLKSLSPDPEGPSPLDLHMASLIERLALFEMLIESLTSKADDLEKRLGGRSGNN